MSSACNWENRVRRTPHVILNDGAFLRDEVKSVPNGRVLPITGHVMMDHSYVAEYERATYVWDRDGTGRRIAK